MQNILHCNTNLITNQIFYLVHQFETKLFVSIMKYLRFSIIGFISLLLWSGHFCQNCVKVLSVEADTQLSQLSADFLIVKQA